MDIELDIACPSCQKKFKEKAKNIRPGNSKVCPHCRKTIKYQGDDVSKIQKSLDDFERSVKNLNKMFTIKL